MRVLVCGGRDFEDREFVRDHLERWHEARNFTTLIAGRAKGVDTMAEDWATCVDLPMWLFPAAWAAHGKAAGYIRNLQMLDMGKPELVLAFAGGRGTQHMIDSALKAGVETWRISKSMPSGASSSILLNE